MQQPVDLLFRGREFNPHYKPKLIYFTICKSGKDGPFYCGDEARRGHLHRSIPTQDRHFRHIKLLILLLLLVDFESLIPMPSKKLPNSVY